MENGKDFIIQLSSARDVEEFVRRATAQPFPVHLDDGQQTINGKSFMEMFCLSLTQPLRVTAECTAQEFEAFQNYILDYKNFAV